MSLETAFSTIRNEIERRNYGDADVLRKSGLSMLSALEDFLKQTSHLPVHNPPGKAVVRNEEGEVIGLQG